MAKKYTAKLKFFAAGKFFLPGEVFSDESRISELLESDLIEEAAKEIKEPKEKKSKVKAEEPQEKIVSDSVITAPKDDAKKE